MIADNLLFVMKNERMILMRRMISLFAVLIIMSYLIPAYSEEKYDPQNTMLALNMAIVSVHRILTTEDRIVLQHEYDNIINKLALGNIESDYEMTELYAELMNFITGKGLRKDESERLYENFKRREQRQIMDSFSVIPPYSLNLWSWLEVLRHRVCLNTSAIKTRRQNFLKGWIINYGN